MQISARLRRTRRSEGVRQLVREATLTPADLVLPIFVSEVDGEVVEIGSMPGVYRWPIERVPEIVESAEAVGGSHHTLWDPCGEEPRRTAGIRQRWDHSAGDQNYPK